MKRYFGFLLTILTVGALGIFVVFSNVEASLTVANPVLQFEHDIDRPGSDYRNFDLARADPRECERACAADGRCKAFSYVRPGVQGSRPRCWLKTQMAAPVASNCCVSGVKGGLEGQINRPGSDILNRTIASPGACRAVCLDNASCRAFTYVKAGVQGPAPRCWLKNRIPPAVPDNCCTSGTVR